MVTDCDRVAARETPVNGACLSDVGSSVSTTLHQEAHNEASSYYAGRSRRAARRRRHRTVRPCRQPEATGSEVPAWSSSMRATVSRYPILLLRFQEPWSATVCWWRNAARKWARV